MTFVRRLQPMKFRSFKHNYHDGQLAGFTLGPRRELTLEVDLLSLELGASLELGVWNLELFA
jgi:hypothetical protein